MLNFMLSITRAFTQVVSVRRGFRSLIVALHVHSILLVFENFQISESG